MPAGHSNSDEESTSRAPGNDRKAPWPAAVRNNRCLSPALVWPVRLWLIGFSTEVLSRLSSNARLVFVQAARS